MWENLHDPYRDEYREISEFFNDFSSCISDFLSEEIRAYCEFTRNQRGFYSDTIFRNKFKSILVSIKFSTYRYQ